MNKMQALKQLHALINVIEQFPDEANMITLIVNDSYKVFTEIHLYRGLEAVGNALGATVEVQMEDDYTNHEYNYQKSFVSYGEPTIEIFQLERKALSEEATA